MLVQFIEAGIGSHIVQIELVGAHHLSREVVEQVKGVNLSCTLGTLVKQQISVQLSGKAVSGKTAPYKNESYGEMGGTWPASVADLYVTWVRELKNSFPQFPYL